MLTLDHPSVALKLSVDIVELLPGDYTVIAMAVISSGDAFILAGDGGGDSDHLLHLPYLCCREVVSVAAASTSIFIVSSGRWS